MTKKEILEILNNALFKIEELMEDVESVEDVETLEEIFKSVDKMEDYLLNALDLI